MAIAGSGLLVSEESLRDDEVQAVLCPGHRDVEKPALLLNLRGRAGSEIGRDAAIDDVQDEDRLPFLPLRGVDRRQDQVVFIAQRDAGLVARCIWRIQGEFGQEALAGGIAARRFARAGARSALRVAASSCMRSRWGSYQRRARSMSAGQPALPARSCSIVSMNGASRRRARGGAAALASAVIGSAGVGHQIEDTMSRSRADARQKLHQPEPGNAIARVLGKPQQREHILDVGGIEEFQAAELHERDVAAGQLDLKRPAVMRGRETEPPAA